MRSAQHVPLENLEMSERKGIIFPLQFMGNVTPVWSKNSSCPLPHARTSLQAQANDKSGSADPLLGPDCTHPYIYVRLARSTSADLSSAKNPYAMNL
jgi:hypothetical protein